MAEVIGFEPTHTGVKVPCLNRLAKPQWGDGFTRAVSTICTFAELFILLPSKGCTSYHPTHGLHLPYLPHKSSDCDLVLNTFAVDRATYYELFCVSQGATLHMALPNISAICGLSVSGCNPPTESYRAMDLLQSNLA